MRCATTRHDEMLRHSANGKNKNVRIHKERRKCVETFERVVRGKNTKSLRTQSILCRVSANKSDGTVIDLASSCEALLSTSFFTLFTVPSGIGRTIGQRCDTPREMEKKRFAADYTMTDSHSIYGDYLSSAKHLFGGIRAQIMIFTCRWGGHYLRGSGRRQ